MTRDEINRLVAHAAGGVDVATTEQVLDGLERVILAELSRGGGKFTRILALYQAWKK